MVSAQYLAALGAVARNAAVPYGYTATLWGTGAATADRLNSPTLPDALAYVAGAWLAFVLLRLAVRGREGAADDPGTKRTVQTGALQILPVGSAILIAVAIGAALALPGPVAWGVAGWTATLVFLAVTSLDLTLLRD